MVRRRIQTQSSQIYGTEEALAKIMQNLSEPTEISIDTMTDLTPKEIFLMSWLETKARMFDSKVIKTFVDKFKKLRVSRLRTGRKEFIILGTGLGEREMGRKKKMTIGDLFAGMG